MDKNTRDFLSLIRNSQFSDVTFSNLMDIDWDYMYTEGVNQAVLGLISTQVPKEIVEKDSRWKQAIYRQATKYIKYTKAEEDLIKLLDDAEIPYVILKGNASAMYYANPSKRQMGDIDFFVLQNQFAKAKELLIHNKYLEIVENVSQPRHVEFKKNGVIFELHQHYSHDKIDIESYIADGFNKKVKYTINNHSFNALPKLINGLVLLEHISAHLKAALGLRQIIDWMLYVYRELDDSYWENEFRKTAHDTGLEKLAISVTRMCQLYLGLPNNITWCQSANETLCKELMANILICGNFGRKNHSGRNVENATLHLRTVGFFRYLQIGGIRNWKACHKYPILKPFAWVYQIFRYLVLGIKSKRGLRQLIKDDKRAKQRIQLLKDLEI